MIFNKTTFQKTIYYNLIPISTISNGISNALGNVIKKNYYTTQGKYERLMLNKAAIIFSDYFLNKITVSLQVYITALQIIISLLNI